MNKTFLEQQIEKRAKQRLDAVLKDFSKAVESNPILKILKIKNDKGEFVRFMNHSGITGNVFFNGRQNCLATDLTNVDEIKAQLLQQYVEEETEELLKKLENISYIFEEQNL